MDGTLLVMWIGFILASYSVVGNDVIQTLGTFLTSNEQRVKWWILWLFGGSIMFITLAYGWSMGDVDYGRLDKFQMPEVYHWSYLLPPLVLMVITRLGIPVSTTFMILTLFSLQDIPNDLGAMIGSVFDTDQKLGGMIEKSLLGYIVAFVSSIFIYLLISRITENHYIKNPISKTDKVKLSSFGFTTLMYLGLALVLLDSNLLLYAALPILVINFLLYRNTTQDIFWTVAQWSSTAFLWSQWLTQDLANIYIYLKGGNQLSYIEFAVSVVILVGLLGYIFYSKGGAVQDVVRAKTNTSDIRSATFVDFIYGVILYIFKYNYLNLFEAKLPMSTTWIFIGLLAGREIGLRLNIDKKISKAAGKMVLSDLGKVIFGLVVSVILVFIIKMVGG